jgi:hypothetical protein
MKRERTEAEERNVDDLRPEYDFDYSRAKPNRFAAELSGDCIAIVLEPDVAAVFRDSATVNALLRSVISALPAATAESKTKR